MSIYRVIEVDGERWINEGFLKKRLEALICGDYIQDFMKGNNPFRLQVVGMVYMAMEIINEFQIESKAINETADKIVTVSKKVA